MSISATIKIMIIQMIFDLNTFQWNNMKLEANKMLEKIKQLRLIVG